MDIVEATFRFEEWLENLTDVQGRAINRKHEEMEEGPFPLLRATFYRWVEHWETRCPELHSRDDDVVLAVGDLHLENFGMWRDSRNRIVWGINDFDEACELPFTSDLVRLATSIVLAGVAMPARASLARLCEPLLMGYREGLETGGRPILVDDGHAELNQLIKQLKDPSEFWDKKLNETDNPKIDPEDLPRRLAEIFLASFPRGIEPGYRRQKEPGGLGSLGRRRFTAVFGKGNQRELREAKTLVPSAFYWWEERTGMLSQTGTLLQRAIRSPDPYLQVHDKWLIRRIAPDSLKIEFPKPEDRRLAVVPAILRLMGFETANVHLGTRGPDQLIRSLKALNRKPGPDWLERATARMVAATRKDHKLWVAR